MATLFTGLAIDSQSWTVLDRLTPLVFDAYQRLQPRVEAGAPVVIVDIDEESIRSLGQWPWPRPVVAQIVDRLGELGAATVAFDIIFSERDRTSLADAVRALKAAGGSVIMPGGQELPDNDAVLAAAFARNNVIAGLVVSNETVNTLPEPKAGFSFAGADPSDYLAEFSGGVRNLDILDRSAAGLGFFSFPPSRDGVVRAIPVVARAQGSLFPTLGIEALRVAQGAGTYIIRATGASGEVDTGVPAMTALKAGALEVPTGSAGELWIYFSGMPSLVTIPAATVLDPGQSKALEEAVAGRIVLVGTSAAGLRDLVATPLQASVAGVRVHAEIIDQILGGTFLTRPDWAKGAEVFVALLLAALLLLIEQKTGGIGSAAAAVTLIGFAVGASWSAFSLGQLLIDPILPAAAVASVFGVTMPILLLLTDRERQFVRRAFTQYLAPSLVERLADNPQALKLGGEVRELTVLFSDIRGFTSLSEGLDPQALTKLLNDFLTPMTDVLLRSEATIDKYMGDAIMAFYNAPLDVHEHQRRACVAALEMLSELKQVNARNAANIKIGVGLNSGACCVGNLGSAQRFSYSAIGDSVNVASRIESLTKSYGISILLTESTAPGAVGMASLEVDLVRVVGRVEPLPIFTLLGDETMANSALFQGLADAHGRLIKAYRSADCDAAEAALAEARAFEVPELATIYALYENRLATMRRDPPPSTWDAVFTAAEK